MCLLGFLLQTKPAKSVAMKTAAANLYLSSIVDKGIVGKYRSLVPRTQSLISKAKSILHVTELD